MKIVVWNSQGAKWDLLWNTYLLPRILLKQDVIGLMVEAGRPPWVKNQETLYVNNFYSITENTADWFDHEDAKKSSSYLGVVSENRRTAGWFPWMKKVEDYKRENLRCSLACIV